MAVAEPQQSTLQDVFPGKSITLSNGRVVTIQPWSAWFMTHELPEKFGGILQAIMPAVAGMQDGEVGRTRLVIALQHSLGTLGTFIMDTAGLNEEDMKMLRASDLTTILAAIVDLNWDFFEGLAGLQNRVAARPLTGATSRRS